MTSENPRVGEISPKIFVRKFLFAKNELVHFRETSTFDRANDLNAIFTPFSAQKLGTSPSIQKFDLTTCSFPKIPRNQRKATHSEAKYLLDPIWKLISFQIGRENTVSLKTKFSENEKNKSRFVPDPCWKIPFSPENFQRNFRKIEVYLNFSKNRKHPDKESLSRR